MKRYSAGHNANPGKNNVLIDINHFDSLPQATLHAATEINADPTRIYTILDRKSDEVLIVFRRFGRGRIRSRREIWRRT